MNPEMKIIREVSIEAEDFYEQAVSLGDHAAEALKARHRSQMTGLENIAESTFKTSDVFDYIKKQTARFSHWQKPFSELKNSNQGFGERLKNYLENDLAKRCDNVCTRLETGDSSYKEKQERRHIYLLLIRQFIRSMVVEYEYQVNVGPKVNSRKEP
jgi:hypothetical protein